MRNSKIYGRQLTGQDCAGIPAKRTQDAAGEGNWGIRWGWVGWEDAVRNTMVKRGRIVRKESFVTVRVFFLRFLCTLFRVDVDVDDNENQHSTDSFPKLNLYFVRKSECM